MFVEYSMLMTVTRAASRINIIPVAIKYLLTASTTSRLLVAGSQVSFFLFNCTCCTVYTFLKYFKQVLMKP